MDPKIVKQAHQLHNLLRRKESGRVPLTGAELAEIDVLVKALDSVGTGTFFTRVRGFGPIGLIGLR